MSWNTLELLLVLTLSIGIATTSPINEAKENITRIQEAVSDETKSLLSNSTEYGSIELRKVHVDEESPKKQNYIIDSDSNSETFENDLKYDVEILQPGKLEKQDIEIEERFKAPSLKFDTNQFYEENIEVNGEVMQQSHIILTAALFVLAFASIGIYAGLVIWRSNLEKRYGMRQRLMTEDDFCANIDDHRPY